jgi:hypothetical protein
VREYSIDQAISFMQEKGIEITDSSNCVKGKRQIANLPETKFHLCWIFLEN